jgi:DNA gyrase subunit A
VINLRLSEQTGEVVAIKGVLDDDELMLITRNGVVNRQRVREIRTIGRATQGVRLVQLDDEDSIMDVARVVPEEAEPGLEDAVLAVAGGSGAEGPFAPDFVAGIPLESEELSGELEDEAGEPELEDLDD